jgi:hypothetical protein
METEVQKNPLLPVVKELPKDLQHQIVSEFEVFALEATEWKERSQGLVVTSIDQVELMEEARVARLALRNIRTSADKTRIKLKEDATKYNKAVQRVYNLIEGAVKPLEEHLLAQEEYSKRIEEAKKAAIREERQAIAQPYYQFIPANIDYAEMTQEDFDRQIGQAQKLKKLEDAELEERVKAREAEEMKNKMIITRQREIAPLFQFIKEHEYAGQEQNVQQFSEEEWSKLISDLTERKEARQRLATPVTPEEASPIVSEVPDNSATGQLEKLKTIIVEAGMFAKEKSHLFKDPTIYEALITSLRASAHNVREAIEHYKTPEDVK